MKVIIIGCTHAGLTAAKEILTNHPETELTIYERNNNFSFSSDGIFLYLKNQVKNLESIFTSSPSKIRQMGAVVRDMHTVLNVDTQKKQIRAVDMQKGIIITDNYDKLIVATGANPRLPAIVGIDNSRVLLCKSFLQAQKIYTMAQSSQRIAIIGAGYAGVEFAESFAQKGYQVDLFQSSDQVLNNYFDVSTSEFVVKLLQKHHVNVHLNTNVTAFTEVTDLIIKLSTSSGDDFLEDMAIVCTGFIPNTRLFAKQLKMEKHGALLLNNYLQTSDPDVYAAGDCAVVHFNPTNKSIYAPLGTNAVRQGFLVSKNIYGNFYPYMGTQTTSALKLFGHNFAMTGLTLKNAKLHGLNAHSTVYQGNWRPDYMPYSEPATLSLVYNRDNRKILGLQLHSKKDLTQSVNTVSLAIQNSNTIDDLSMTDMFFQPNFDQPFNYLNIVAQIAVKHEKAAGFDNPRFTTLY